MPEQHGVGADASRGGIEGVVPRATSGCLRAALPAHLDRRDEHGVEPVLAEPSSRTLRLGGRLRPQAVVDDDGSDPGTFGPARGREGDRVGTTGTRHEDERLGRQVGETLAHRAAYLDRRVGHGSRSDATRAHHAAGSSTSSRVGSVVGSVQTRPNPSRPTSSTTPLTKDRPSVY